MSTVKQQKLVIWGAGKIGRGFIADLFFQNGYQITFIDQDQDHVELLRQKKSYQIRNIPNKQPEEVHTIHRFQVFHTSEKEAIQMAMMDADMVAISLFPQMMEQSLKMLKPLLFQRKQENPDQALDILLCTNSLGIAGKLNDLMVRLYDEELLIYIHKKIGIVECLLMRIVIDPPTSEPKLNLITNAYPNLVMDKSAFKGSLPEGTGFILTERIAAEEYRKIYTYNMVHAVFAYGGHVKNYELVNQATEDPELLELARKSLEEVSFGLQHEFGFTAEEMKIWNQEVMINMTNPVLEDTIFRVANDPMRKLSREERLIGPALLCRKYGMMPYYLGISIYNALQYNHPRDPSSASIQDMIREQGLKDAFEKIAGIDREKELTGLILLIDRHRNTKPEISSEYIDLLKKAYQLGYFYEKKYRGCAQCLLGAMYELTGQKNDELFRAASAFSGGMSLCGDGVCGGYTGGLMFTGLFTGRRLEFFSGDKEEQYKAYELGQMMHDKYMETYGTVTCKHIHEEIYGQAYILRTKEVRNRFEEAGAHRDKCTSVIGMAAVWLTEILVENELLDPKTLNYEKTGA